MYNIGLNRLFITPSKPLNESPVVKITNPLGEESSVEAEKLNDELYYVDVVLKHIGPYLLMAKSGSETVVKNIIRVERSAILVPYLRELEGI